MPGDFFLLRYERFFKCGEIVNGHSLLFVIHKLFMVRGISLGFPLYLKARGDLDVLTGRLPLSRDKPKSLLWWGGMGVASARGEKQVCGRVRVIVAFQLFKILKAGVVSG